MNQTEYDQFVDAVAENLAQRAIQNCDTPIHPCATVLWSEITIEAFYRSGRTVLDQLLLGAIPIVPGQSATLTQIPHPGWLAGCFKLTYRLANNGTNHQDVEIRFLIDNIPLDTVIYGSEIYDNANHMIGDGMIPVPMAHGKQCCVGAMNRLQVEIRHTGANNQIEQPRIFVSHGMPACCNACSVGKMCQVGCKQKNGNGNGDKPKPVPMLAAGFNGGNIFVVKQQ